MNHKEYLALLFAGLFTAAFKILKENTKGARSITVSVMVSIIIVIFLVPAIMEYFEFSLRVGLGLASSMTLISEKIIDLIEKKLPDKINNTLK